MDLEQLQSKTAKLLSDFQNVFQMDIQSSKWIHEILLEARMFIGFLDALIFCK